MKLLHSKIFIYMDLKIVNYNGATREKIDKVEDELFVNLHEDYKEFLQTFNEGVLENLYCFDRKLINDTQGITFEKFLSISEIRKLIIA